jgi:eukaryotic-like serine/threonine-protein kinase
MAPEQASGNNRLVTTLSDVYGLGAVLFALLTGKPPFGGASTMETLDQVRQQQPVSPSRLNSKVPRDLEIICLKCLEKDPQRRYPSAQALAVEVRRFLIGEPIQARRVSAFEKGWLWCRRCPLIAGLTAVLLAAVLAGLIDTSPGMVAALHARQKALNREQDALKA